MDVVRQRVVLRGVVQGVGFRPHVAQVAARHPITGFCGNDATSVFIEAQGTRDAVEAFITDVLATLPPLAHVLDRTDTSLPVSEEKGFSIAASISNPGERTLIPPDVATCDECLADMADPGNRRSSTPSPPAPTAARGSASLKTSPTTARTPPCGSSPCAPPARPNTPPPPTAASTRNPSAAPTAGHSFP